MLYSSLPETLLSTAYQAKSVKNYGSLCWKGELCPKNHVSLLYHLTLQNALQNAFFCDMFLSRSERLYEFFEFDVENASFEWDEAKDKQNFKKHGIHFKTAAKIFLDPYKLIRKDEEHPEEERYNILGKVGKVLFVVCVFKEENIVRLISARVAAVPEKERYDRSEDVF